MQGLNEPVCTDTPPKQLRHPSRTSNYSSPNGSETPGQHPEPCRCAYATARFVFPQSLPGTCKFKYTSTTSYACGHKHNHGVNVTQATHRLGWEGNKHNSVKSVNSFTFLQSDGKQRSAACPQPGWTRTQTHLLHQLTAF